MSGYVQRLRQTWLEIRGSGPVILPNAAALAAIALVFLAASYLVMRERLE